jgi:hypothetical protein
MDVSVLPSCPGDENMPTLAKKQAVEHLVAKVEKAPADELVEIYNELFPEHPTSEAEARPNVAAFRKKVLAYIDQGLEVEEILDLWNVIFPKDRDIWFDEQKKKIRYVEGDNAVETE